MSLKRCVKFYKKKQLYKSGQIDLIKKIQRKGQNVRI